LFGGAGRDTFVFGSTKISKLASLGVDTIQDFTVADDKIQLSKTTFAILNTVGILAADKFSTVTTDAAATATGAIVYNSTTGNLFYNANAAAAGFGTTGGQFAHLNPGLTLTNNLFEVVA
jgi:Ca2+-binding RTX toxin-like protein